MNIVIEYFHGNVKPASPPNIKPVHYTLLSLEEGERIISYMLVHNNVYGALRLPLSSEISVVLDKLEETERGLGNLKTCTGVTLAPLQECISRLRISRILLKNKYIRIMYLELAKENASTGIPIPNPPHEICHITFITMAIITRIQHGFTWDAIGFPVKTKTGLLWIQTQTLTAWDADTPKEKDQFVTSKLVELISKNIILTKSEIAKITSSLILSLDWKTNNCKRDRFMAFSNGLLNMKYLEFHSHAQLKASSNKIMLDTCPFSTHTPQNFAPSEEDLNLLETVRKEAISVRGMGRVAHQQWLNTWNIMPGMQQLQAKMPMYMQNIIRHDMMNSPNTQSDLFRTLSRGLYGKYGGRMLLLLGPSGSGKTTCVDVLCEIVGPSKSIHVNDTTQENFPDEMALGKRMVVYSDMNQGNRITFQKLSNFMDMNSRQVNVKCDKNVMSKPAELVVGTSNTPHIMKITSNSAAKLDAAAIARRILPMVYENPIEPTCRREDARSAMRRNEGFYIVCLILTHRLFAMYALKDDQCGGTEPKLTEDLLLSIDSKNMANLVTNEILTQGRQQSRSTDSLTIPDCENKKFWKNAVYTIKKQTYPP